MTYEDILNRERIIIHTEKKQPPPIIIFLFFPFFGHPKINEKSKALKLKLKPL
jgi:hypothetical protein